jgi:hypothetical protein
VLNWLLRLVAAVAVAAMMTAASAAVYPPQQQLPAATIDAFKENPSSLLTQFPVGGAGLISRVRDLGASDPATLPLLLGLLKTADPKTQVPAIAAGLAQLARLASKADQAYADAIQQGIAGSGNEIAIAAYTASTGDAPIAAVGGGGGGTGGGGQTGTGGIIFGSTNTGTSTFGALHYSNSGPLTPTVSVGSLSASSSPR